MTSRRTQTDLKTLISDVCQSPDFFQELSAALSSVLSVALEKKLSDLTRELEQLTDDLLSLEFKHDNLEKYSRRKNLRIK